MSISLNIFLDCLQAVRAHKFNFPPTPLYDNLKKVRYDRSPWKEKYLKPLARGERLGAFALSEPEAGSDATSQKTEAVHNGDHW